MEVVACPEPGCAAPAEVLERFVLASTSGPVEHSKTVCVGGQRPHATRRRPPGTPPGGQRGPMRHDPTDHLRRRPRGRARPLRPVDRGRGQRRRRPDRLVRRPAARHPHPRARGNRGVARGGAAAARPPPSGCSAGTSPHRRRGGAVLCDARATVWLDSPVLPAQTVRRLRFGPLPLGEVLRPLGGRRHTTSVSRRHDYGRPVEHDDDERPVLLVRASLLVAGQPVALVEETYLEAVLSPGG
jgi:hypothetical protein